MYLFKNHNKLLRKLVVFSIILIFGFMACEENEFLKKPTVKTVRVENTGALNTFAVGEFINQDEYEIKEFGFCWSESDNPTKLDDELLIDLEAANSNFNIAISEFEPNKTYYLRAFASNSVGTGYGEVLSFTTDNGNILITTLEVEDITAKSVTCGGNITDDGGSEVIDRGICYNTSQSPTVYNSSVQDDNNGIGTFNCGIDGLLPGTIYYMRAFATNGVGTSYGNEIIFTTEDGLPIVSTSIVSNIATSSATSGGNVSDDSDFAITARGVCWNIEPLPTITNGHTTDNSGLGDFESEITGLVIGTNYYIRAYASNENGTAYGEELRFFTDIVDYDANEYDVTIIGNQVWMAENLKATHYATGVALKDGTGVGSIWDDETSKYYFAYDDDDANSETYGRLYTWAAAMNSTIGSVTYSTGVQGVCPDGWHMPGDSEWKELEIYLGMNQADVDQYGMRGTDEGNKLKSTSGWSSVGNGTNEFGFSALPAGWRDGNSFRDLSNCAFFWAGIDDHDGYPLARRLIFDQGGIGSDGTGGNIGLSVRCVMGIVPPTVSTDSVLNITASSATVKFNVTSDGGDDVAENGIYYGTSANSETTGTKLQIGSNTGTFSTSLTGLSPNTTYYIKAYATNSVGTSYGNELTFITYNGTVTDFDGNVYNTILVGAQEWMAENLKTTHYADGTEITLVDNLWGTLTVSDKAYCYYDNSISNGDIYGALYSWNTAMNSAASSVANPSGVQGVCPDGWHLPSDEEWKELEMALGMSQVDADAEDWRGTDEGIKLKSTYGWSNDGNGNNSSGLSFLPGAYRDQDGPFYELRLSTLIWTATEYNTDRAHYRSLNWGNKNVYRKDNSKLDGNSVRCVKD